MCNYCQQVFILTSLPCYRSVYWEAIALCRTVQRSAELFTLLNKLGFYCHPRNVLNLTDSSAVCFMAKTPPSNLEKRFSHVISKMALHLLSISCTPQESVHFFSQTNKKRTTGCLFMADVLTKIPPGMSEEEMVVKLPALWGQSQEWLHSPVQSWHFITDYPPSVAMKHCTSSQFKLTNVSASELCKERFLSASSSHCHLNVKLEEATARRTKCAVSIETDIKFQRLLKRKLSQICNKGSAINILALCKFYILKLKHLTKLGHTERLKKRNCLLQNLANRTKGLSPFWASCRVRCGLVPGLSCGAEHHIETFQFFGALKKCLASPRLWRKQTGQGNNEHVAERNR